MLKLVPQQKPIIEFSPVLSSVSDVEDTERNDLNTNQWYLTQRRYNASDNPNCYLQSAQPGINNHKRWITKANQ